MNVMPEWNTTGDLETAILEPTGSAAPTAPEQPETPAASEPALSEPAASEPALSEPAASGAPQPEGAGANGELTAGIAASVRELADSAGRYHARAEQRESVIDHLRAEVERLRRGERRGLLRPLLAEICRLRNDLLRQAGELPADFDTDRAASLLRSYAESVELALENSGVVTFAPDSGDAFDPRMHRRVGAEPTGDPAFAGRIARVRRDGYLDVEANSPIAPAEVVVFAAAAPESRQDKKEEQ
jgi:molecular chaperone GrpE (heat shock protein)